MNTKESCGCGGYLSCVAVVDEACDGCIQVFSNDCLFFHLPWLSNCNLQHELLFNRCPLLGVSRYDDGAILSSEIVQ